MLNIIILLFSTVSNVSLSEVKKDIEGNPPRILAEVPDFSLIDQEKNINKKMDLMGHIWVVNFMFTECKEICPLQTSAMNVLNKNLAEFPNYRSIKLISISVDPENDSPKVLREYIKNRNLNTKQWKFFTGEREDIWNLSKNGFKLPVAENSKDLQMPILHGSHFVLVDPQGKIRGYYNALTQDGFDKLTIDLAYLTQQIISVPKTVMYPPWVDTRKNDQVSQSKSYKIFHDFKFSDQVLNSGITFRHKIIDDVGSSWKAAHYDHGNGIAVADIDGDGLHDIYFTTLAGTNELWRNLGSGKFENVTRESGLFLEDRIGMAASFGDIDNDGDPDLYVTSIREGNLLYENNGDGKFINITNKSGVGVNAHSSSATFFDYDRDGLLDLFVTNVGVYTSEVIEEASVYPEQGSLSRSYEYYLSFKDAFSGHLKPERSESSILFKNLGGNKFQDVTRQMDLVDLGWNGDAIVMDGNNDGWSDLYLLNMQGNDEYYENYFGEKFIRKGRAIFPKTPWGAMGAKSFDFDNDGDLDLYVTDMHSDMRDDLLGKGEKKKSPQPYPDQFLKSGGNSLFGNAFYRNEGDGSFSEISNQIGAENFWPWGVSTGDFNADGFEDVFITSSMNYPFRYAPNSLLLNNRGKGFLDSEYVVGIEPRKNDETAAPWFELKCSGDDMTNILCKSLDGPKVVWGALGSRSSAIFDMDLDGDQDIITLEFNQPPMLLVNNLNERRAVNFIKVDLDGVKSNKSGVGAKVQVFAEGQVYTKVQDGKSGYLSQSDIPLYFGLDGAKKIDRIEVLWPSGSKQVISKNIIKNTLLTITES